MLKIGIDTGVNTGFAVVRSVKLESVECLQIHQALERVKGFLEAGEDVQVFVEDARQRKWIPNQRGREVLQGVGSVKRDALIWEDFLKDLVSQYGESRVSFRMMPPKSNKTKLDTATFKRLTGWEGRTNEHGRDAAMLVYGMK